MTYACTLTNQDSTVTVDFDKTYNEGGGPQYSYVNEIAVMEAPADSTTGATTAQALDFKYTQESISISGQFKDGLGTADGSTPGSTKFEKLLYLCRVEIVSLIFAWPVSAKTWYCVPTRFTCGEQGAHGETLSYDITLRIVGS